MNETMLREAAEDRLLTAELAEVMGCEVARAGASRRPWRQLYVAALVLLSAAVTLGVAWLARGPDTMAQDPPFDAADPWHEHEWPLRPGWGAALVRPIRADRAPPDIDEFAVTMREEDSSDLAAALDRPAVRRLALSWRNDAATANVSDALWQRLVVRPELEVLILAGRFGFPPERLRDLRRLPSLRYLLFADGAATLDPATAQALTELPRLRGLMLASVEVAADALGVLGGLPDLEFLGLLRVRGEAGVATVLPQLRGLRALVLEQDPEHRFIDATLFRALANLPRLTVLDVWHAEIDDAMLTALPARLELLGLSRLDGCTGAGVDALRRLAKLRTLRLRALLPETLQAPMLEVMRAARLERFDLLVGRLDAAVWEVLQQLPGLRKLTLRPTGAAVQTVFRDASACAHLEELIVHIERLPRPELLAPLRDHAALRRIVLLHDVMAPPFDAEVLAALRASVTVPIDVLPR